MGRFSRGFWRGIGGSAAAEFALLVPVFALLVFGIFHFCALLYAASSLHWSVEQAARCASVSVRNTGLDCGTTINSTETYAGDIYKGPRLTELTFAHDVDSEHVTGVDSACAGRRVAASGTYEIRTGFLNVDVPISATACFPADTTVTWNAS
jgi:hypothetical protein